MSCKNMQEKDATQWKISTTSAEAWQDMLQSCREARHSIDLEQYIFGATGKIADDFRELLIARARAGVRVRLLLDAVGSFPFYESQRWRDFLMAGVEMRFHRAIIPPNFKRFLPLILRDHRKLLIVDGREMYIGGVILDEMARHWRDTSVRLVGAVVADAEQAFTIAWEHTESMQPMGRVFSKEGRDRFSLAGNSFHLRDKDLYRTIIHHILSAKKSIMITTPYFSLTRDIKRALYYAVKRGVHVRILLPRCSDNFLADVLSRWYYRRLLRRGIQIFQYSGRFLHAKSITIDTNWASVGSCNFDWLSFRLNYELNVLSSQPDFVAELEAVFEQDLKHAEPLMEVPSFHRWFFTRLWSRY